jgi:hypothetical protein
MRLWPPSVGYAWRTDCVGARRFPPSQFRHLEIPDLKHPSLRAAALCLSATLASCGPQNVDIGSGSEEEGQGSTGRELNFWSGATAWPNGVVPVCWTAASLAFPNFATLSAQVRNMTNNSWPQVANVSFTGWGPCPADATSRKMVRIDLNNSSAADSGGFGVGSYQMNLGIARGDWLGSLMPHEFGHVLGFTHEMGRADFADDALGSCSEANATGNTLNTAPDRQSIMASTGYCQQNSNLSLWDVKGVGTLYGTRVGAFSILSTAYNNSRGDHATVATAQGNQDVRDQGYTFAYSDGWVFAFNFPGTVPLKLYFHAGRGDYLSAATKATEDSAIAAGYTFVRNEGYVYSASQPGTVPLKLFWHGGRADNLVTASPAAEAAALGAGYSFVRNEGYLFNAMPYSLVWEYWHPGRGDNLSTVSNSALANASDGSAYFFTGFDGALMNFNVEGTAAMNTWWGPLPQDHFLTGTVAGANSAVAAGYSRVATEGYAFATQIAGDATTHATDPMTLFWSGARGDNFTTMRRAADAIGAGYATVRVEGYGLSTTLGRPNE